MDMKKVDWLAYYFLQEELWNHGSPLIAQYGEITINAMPDATMPTPEMKNAFS
jgi:hypothetical protein